MMMTAVLIDQPDTTAAYAVTHASNDQIEAEETTSTEDSCHQGKLVLDATVVEQAIRYPTDLSLLNEAREFTEQIIDQLYTTSALQHKPRIYSHTARKAYLGLVKQRRLKRRALRHAIKQQLQYVRRNLGHIMVNGVLADGQ